MTENALAPSSHAGRPQQHTSSGQDPFATPTVESVQPPMPCARPPHDPRFSQDPTAIRQSEQTSRRHDRSTRPSSGDESLHSRSVSSNGGSPHTTPMSSLDLEKSSIAHEQAPRRTVRDPEKAMHSGTNSPRRQPNIGDSISMTYSADDSDEDEEGRRLQEQNAFKILFFLSGPCLVLSAFNAVWTCISLIITVLTQPVRLCARRPSFGQQMGGLLGPALNLQLRAIYTPLAPHANEDMSYYSSTLLVVHILSPFLSFVLMFMAWVLAAYWLVSTMIGDPAGLDKRDDGRESVLSLRGCWEYWLMRSVKDE